MIKPFAFNTPSLAATGSKPPADKPEADPFLDCVQVKTTVTFDKPFTMEDLAKAMRKNEDGSITFSFGEDSGAHVVHHDQDK
ncbi:MAG: hypothetical protein AB7S38_30930 [Vulcanimicrobiota bacterium]